MRELLPKPKLSISKLLTLFIVTKASRSNLSEKLKNGIKSLVGQMVLDLLIRVIFLDVLIDYSGTTWPNKILMYFFSFSDNLL